MAALGDLIAIVVVGFVIVAGLSLLSHRGARDTSLRAPGSYIRQCATAAGPECWIRPRPRLHVPAACLVRRYLLPACPHRC